MSTKLIPYDVARTPNDCCCEPTHVFLAAAFWRSLAVLQDGTAAGFSGLSPEHPHVLE